VRFEATETKTAYLCGCKHTANQPFCDGSHSKL
jgi:CDGSH-type Zn-finger protein